MAVTANRPKIVRRFISVFFYTPTLARDLPADLTRKREAIAHPWLRQQVTRLRRIGLDFFAKLVDEHAQVFHLVAIVRSPDGLQQPAMRDGDIRIRHEELEKIELFGSQADLTALGDHAARGQVDLNSVQTNGFRSALGGRRQAAKRGADA